MHASAEGWGSSVAAATDFNPSTEARARPWAQDDRMRFELMSAVAVTTDLSLLDEVGIRGAGSAMSILGVLAVLALIDSTAFGTSLVPLWLMLAPGKLRAGRVMMYLLTLAGGYALVGLVILATLTLVGEQAMDAIAGAREQTTFLIVQLAIGAGLIWYSSRLDPFTKAGKERKQQRMTKKGATDRVSRFRARAVGPESGGGVWPLMGLALLAVVAEFATLLPYLAGIGLVAAEGPPMPGSAGMIVFYCAVMITPATLLLIGRVVAGRTLDRPLKRLEGFLNRHANGAVALVLFLLGLWMSINALGALQG